MNACSLRMPEYTCVQEAGPESLSVPGCYCKLALPDAAVAAGCRHVLARQAAEKPVQQMGKFAQEIACLYRCPPSHM